MACELNGLGAPHQPWNESKRRTANRHYPRSPKVSDQTIEQCEDRAKDDSQNPEPPHEPSASSQFGIVLTGGWEKLFRSVRDLSQRSPPQLIQTDDNYFVPGRTLFGTSYTGPEKEITLRRSRHNNQIRRDNFIFVSGRHSYRYIGTMADDLRR